MLTLIGTPPNLVISETLEDNGFAPLAFFSFLPVGIIVIAMGVAILLPMSLMLIKKKDKQQMQNKEKSLDELAEEYQLPDKLYKYGVGSSADSLSGLKVGELDLHNNYGLTILEIRNEKRNALSRDISQNMAWADTRINHEDIIYFYGDEEGMNQKTIIS